MALVFFKEFYRRRTEQAMTAPDDRVSDNELYWIYIRSMAPAFMLVACTSILLTSLQFVKSQAAFIASCVLLAVYRSLLFSTCINFIMIAFPLRNFGLVNGITNTISCLINLLENALKQVPIIPGTGIALGISCLVLLTPIFFFIKRR
ncbi:unnamed protein product [Echinostoma caproni]|uniref:Permease n=1 Tax=Echinostoma caproni TaxID=27848 RepID=A0A182ZZ89_9TREM|nr:unnamed protein product [Echinostoma caproni]